MTRLFACETGDARALLRRCAGAVWGLEALPELSCGDRGKPRFPARPDLCFNLSHSGPWALCALSDEAVGVDMEAVRPRRPILPPKALSEAEYAWFRARGGAWEDFYTLWTLKEARVKCLGSGLDRPARDIAVPLLSPGESALLDGLRFTSYAGEGWRAALCSGGDTALIEWLHNS